MKTNHCGDSNRPRKPLRIIFCGATELGFTSCSHLISKGFEIVGIFTIPKEFYISYSKDKPVKNVLYRDFHELGRQHGIPVSNVEGQMTKFEKEFEELRPDLILAIGWYFMVPLALRSKAPHGCLGLHASLLPKYRGGAPLVWALINGEVETGVTLFYMDDGIDSGDILAQESFPIGCSDTILDVLGKAERATLNILPESLVAIQEGTSIRRQQNHRLATYYPQRKPEDGEIDWSWEPVKIKNFIRAQTRPYPGAFTYRNGKKVILWDADVILLEDC